MNFEDLSKAWQAHDHGVSDELDAERLLSEARRSHQAMEAALFRRDLCEIGAAAVLTCIFLISAVSRRDWAFYVASASCFAVGMFLFIDRRIQRARRPAFDGSLKSCLVRSLREVQHQIWLLKNVFWWYLLPLAIGMLCVNGSVSRTIGRPGLAAYVNFGVVSAVCCLAFWVVYRLNQRAVVRVLVPRREELETLLRRLEQ